jgi:hypothetical protein
MLAELRGEREQIDEPIVVFERLPARCRKSRPLILGLCKQSGAIPE